MNKNLSINKKLDAIKAVIENDGHLCHERKASIDLMKSLLDLSAIHQYKVFLLGASPEVVKDLAVICEELYGPDLIIGYCHGYFDQSLDRHIAEAIARSRPQVLFVGMPDPRKKNFLHKNRFILSNINCIVGAEGSFEVLSGKIKPTPLWMRRIGLEWFWKSVWEQGKYVELST